MAMTELHWTEVDGVATVWVDTPPPLKAALLFRTGRADETLASSGQTHLIEHMAMSRVTNPARSQGFVGVALTGFATMGRPEEVSTFLLDICNALGSLHGDRLDAEKRVLKAEGVARTYNVCANLQASRFGAMGYGLAGLPELGFHDVAVEKLCDFRLQRFTSGNAVLWLSGPLPAGLRLELPPGEKHPPPPLVPIQQVFPSWVVDNRCGGIAAGTTVPRGPASPLFCAIAGKRLRRMLRFERAISYAPTVIYEPLDANTAHLVLYADSDLARRTELTDAFGEVIEGLKEFDSTEIAVEQEETHERMMGSLAPPLDQRAGLEVNRAAVDWLLGREFVPLELLDSQALAVTAEDLAVLSSDAQRSVMFALPSKSPIRPWIGERASTSSVQVVQGRRIRNVDAPVRRELLVHGLDGVSALWPNGWHTTVRYSELAAAVYYEDGCVHLIGRDGAFVIVEPTLWRNGESVCREIRELVPGHLLLNHGSRPAGTIPRPTTNAWQRLLALLFRREPRSRGSYSKSG